MKLTKNCLYPWEFLQIHAGGMVQCCAVGNDTDMGDFIIDHCQKVARGQPSAILNSPGLVRLREGLLTGNLRPMCRSCFFVDDHLITTEELTRLVKEMLRLRLPDGTNLDAIDLSKTYAYTQMAISFTNRCNLSCVYCIQSTQKKSNPFFKLDFPDEYAESTLDFMVAQGIRVIRTCVEGEATLYKRWYEIFSSFKKKYPRIHLNMTTNLSRCYSEEEIDLLARYTLLDISCDTLDPELYARLRCGGNLELVLSNIKRVQDKVKELGIQGPTISLHSVVSDVVWPTLEQFVDYAFANGMVPLLGNYEERSNALSYQKNICRPITSMPIEEQIKIQDLIKRVKDELEKRGYKINTYIQGGILSNLTKVVERNYNRFTPYDANPLHRAFFEQHPKGKENMHLDIVYDYDNITYNGVLFSRPGQTLRLEGFGASHAVVREVSIYQKGHESTKYAQTILPGYRKTVSIEGGNFEYTPVFADNVEQILLEISEWW
jgi:molybdenum cofactor biosynthesis enzyme MoaA